MSANRVIPGKVAQACGYPAMDRPEAMYLGLVSHWKNPSSLVIDGHEPTTELTNPSQWLNTLGFTGV